MTVKRSYLFVLYLIGFAFLIVAITPVVFAQTADQQVEQRKAQLEAELREIEKEIEEQQVLLEGKQNERVSLERDVAILDAKINKAKLSI